MNQTSCIGIRYVCLSRRNILKVIQIKWEKNWTTQANFSRTAEHQTSPVCTRPLTLRTQQMDFWLAGYLDQVGVQYSVYAERMFSRQSGSGGPDWSSVHQTSHSATTISRFNSHLLTSHRCGKSHGACHIRFQKANIMQTVYVPGLELTYTGST